MQILDNQTDSTKIKIAAYAALVIPICIMLLKFVGTMLTGSLSMQAALIDSISDIISSVFIIASVHIAQRPENDEYQFGFAKVESLGALAQAIFIFASGIFFIIEAYQALFIKQEIRNIGMVIVLIACSLCFLTILTQLQKYVIKKTDSLIIKSSFLHFHMDIFIDLGVLASIFASQFFGVMFFDSIFGILVTAYILSIAFKLLRQALDELIDRGFSKQDLLVLNNVIKKYEDTIVVSKMLTRCAGGRKFVTLMVNVRNEMQIKEACKITDSIRQDVMNLFKNVMIHIEIFSKN